MEARAAPDHVITANAEDLMPLNYDQLSRTGVRLCGTNGRIYGKTYRECVASEKKKLSGELLASSSCCLGSAVATASR